jgi:hypothetical protein
MAETEDLKSFQYQFESGHGHHATPIYEVPADRALRLNLVMGINNSHLKPRGNGPSQSCG